MRKFVTVALLLCLFTASLAFAERKTLPTTEELYGMAENSVVALSAINPRDNGDFYNLTGTIVSGKTEKDKYFVTVATSLETIVLGYSDIRIHSDKRELNTKSAKMRFCFDYNLVFIDYEISKSNLKHFSPFNDRALPISDVAPEVGQQVFVIRATPNATAPHSVLPVRLSSSITPKGRNYNLYTIDSKLAGGSLEGLIGSPVINRMGGLIGVLNIDLDPTISGKSIYPEAYLETVFIHPAKGFLANSSNDTFPKATGHQTSQGGITGHWLPVRFGPLTQAWREAADLPPNVRGVVVTNIYPEGSGCGLKIGDIISHIEGVAVSAVHWTEANNLLFLFLRLLPKNQTGNTWSVELTVYREGQETAVNASMPLYTNPRMEVYNCDRLGIEFVEINDFSRYINDYPGTISGVLASRPIPNRRYTIAVLRGLAYTVIKEVNGRTITNISSLKESVEGTGSGNLRFLVLDLRDFQNKYITIRLD